MYIRLSFDFSDKSQLFLAQRMGRYPSSNGRLGLDVNRVCHGRLCALLWFVARYDTEILQNDKK